DRPKLHPYECLADINARMRTYAFYDNWVVHLAIGMGRHRTARLLHRDHRNFIQPVLLGRFAFNCHGTVDMLTSLERKPESVPVRELTERAIEDRRNVHRSGRADPAPRHFGRGAADDKHPARAELGLLLQ